MADRPVQETASRPATGTDEPVEATADASPKKAPVLPPMPPQEAVKPTRTRRKPKAAPPAVSAAPPAPVNGRPTMSPMPDDTAVRPGPAAPQQPRPAAASPAAPHPVAPAPAAPATPAGPGAAPPEPLMRPLSAPTAAPAPSRPAPSMPAPGMPAPSMPAPSMSAPVAPAPVPGTPLAPAPGTIPGGPESWGVPPAAAPTGRQRKVKQPRRPAAAAPAPRRTPRKARLRLTRIDPWSVMKVAFLLSIAIGIVTVISVMTVWAVLGAAGVWDSINTAVDSVVSGDGTSSFNVNNYVGLPRVLGFTVIVAVIDVVLLTVAATLAAFLYNMAASLLGGIELTLAEEEG